MCAGVTKESFCRDFKFLSSMKIRFYKAIENFLKIFFLCEFAYEYSLLCLH